MAKKPTGNEVLREVRLALDMTQEEFALECDIGDVYLSKLETGKYLIGSEAGLKVFDAFERVFGLMGYSLEDLIRSGR